MFTSTTYLPLPREKVFAFFADPRNLGRLTPSWLKFRIRTPEPLPVGQGAVFDYTLRLHGLPIRWRTLITVWQEAHAFEDLQLKGPYALWHHRHTFEDTPDGGTRVTDEVRYCLPFGWLGALALPWVKRDVAKIFAHREAVLVAWAAAMPELLRAGGRSIGNRTHVGSESSTHMNERKPGG